jgi:hypothetical protein
MRRSRHRIAKFVAVVLAAGAGAATPAVANAKYWSERAGDRPAEPAEVQMDTQTQCALWEEAMARSLALYGITGSQAVSYLAQRADNPCHVQITPRSLFHAGDPGAA